MNPAMQAASILALTAADDLDGALTLAEGDALAVYVALAAVQTFDGFGLAFGLEPDHERLAAVLRTAVGQYAALEDQ